MKLTVEIIYTLTRQIHKLYVTELFIPTCLIYKESLLNAGKTSSAMILMASNFIVLLQTRQQCFYTIHIVFKHDWNNGGWKSKINNTKTVQCLTRVYWKMPPHDRFHGKIFLVKTVTSDTVHNRQLKMHHWRYFNWYTHKCTVGVNKGDGISKKYDEI